MFAKNRAKTGGAGKTGELRNVVNRFGAALDNFPGDLDALLSDIVHHGGAQHLAENAVEVKTAQAKTCGNFIEAQWQG